MQVLAGKEYIIGGRVEVPGEGISPFVFCSGWLLEVVDVGSGEYSFLRDGKRIITKRERFGAYYPAFTFVRTYINNFKGKVRGVGSLEPLPGLPTEPVMFETNFRGKFENAGDAVSVFAAAANVQAIGACSSPSPISTKAKNIIDENYLVYPSIGRVAERLGVSHAHMTRQFKRDFEMTPSEYLHHLRVADATFRLSTGQPIIDISYEVGYNDLSRFYKQFRKNTNTSPAHCREMLDR